MKKLLIANAVLLACGMASAQSSVTLFGIVDANLGYVDADASDKGRFGLGGHGRSTSRFGIRGSEDLGGGLKASFWLEGEVNVDDGQASGLNFRRTSILSLSGDFGEVRLGRDLLPSFLGTAIYDVWGTTGIGYYRGWDRWVASSANPDDNGIRANNLVVYRSPNYDGFSGSVGYAFDEKSLSAGGSNNVGRYMGGYLRYANGPLSMAVAVGQQKTGDANVAADRDEFSIGGQYDIGVAKIGSILMQTSYKPDGGQSLKYNSYAVNAAIPVGGGTGMVNLSYALYDQKAISSKSHHIAAGYDYFLSKRTTLYGIVAHMKNNDNAALGLSARGVYTGATLADEGQTGVQVGIRHSF